MKKIFRTVAALAVVMFAGCTTDFENEVVTPGVGAGKTTVTVGIEDTKTYLGELVDGARKVYWHNGDQININGVASTAIELNDDKTSATFTFEDAELNYPYSVLYPAEMYKDAQTITLPAVQNAATNSFAGDTAPMAAHVTEGNVILHHLAGVVRLQVKLPAESTHGNHTLNKVETKGNAGEQMSGDFTIDYEAATLTATSTAEADKIVTTSASKELSAEETDDVFIVVPAREYTQGITVRLIDKAGHYMDIASKAMTIEAGEIKAMPVVEFVPTGTLVGVEIASAADLVAFARAYNAREYADVEPLVVHLMNDITFDDETNAAWEPIGCKDAEGDNYFDGTFEGNDHSIKNWVSRESLFGYTASASTIQNLTIDASCTLNLSAIADTDRGANYGAFVAYHKGELNNCHNNAALTVTGSGYSGNVAVGSLVGRLANGSVVNCSVSGDVTMDSGFKTASSATYFGGVVGRSTDVSGVISGTYFYGNLAHKGGSSYKTSNANNASVYIGGIVGLLTGTCTDCHLDNATVNNKHFFVGNYVHAEIATEEQYNGNDYRNLYVGGIVGQVAADGNLENCTNDSLMEYCQYNGEDNGSSTDVSRHFNAGGIAGQVLGDVSGCTMYGNAKIYTSCLQQKIGGVIGILGDDKTYCGSISNCKNEGVNIDSGYSNVGYAGARGGFFGGVIGMSYSANVSKVSNKAYLRIQRMNQNDNATAVIGGIFGAIQLSDIASIVGNDEIVNYGKLEFYVRHKIKNYTIGGVAGIAQNVSFTSVKNEGEVLCNCRSLSPCVPTYVGGVVGQAQGNVTLDDVSNTGKVAFKLDSSNQGIHVDICVGGILGTNIDGSTVSIINSENSGAVESTGDNNVDTRSIGIGGIAGAVVNGASSITSCTNTGSLYNNVQSNPRKVFAIRVSGGGVSMGGIVGYAEGAEGDLLEVSGCANNCVDSTGSAGYGIYAKRGNCAGLIGSAKYADVKLNDCTTNIYMTNTTYPAGLVSQMMNSNLEGNTITNSIVNANNGGSNTGGFCAYVVASTIVDNVMNNVAITGKATQPGVIVGEADSATTITNNKVSGTLQGAVITLDSKMVFSGSPTVTGTTLYTE